MLSLLMGLLLVLGSSLTVQGVTLRSFGSYQDIAPSPPRSQHILTPVLSALARGDQQAAREMLDAILRKNPMLVAAHELDGIMRANAGDLSGAEQALRQALKLSGTPRAIHVVYGKVLFHQGRYAEAEPQFQRYLRVAPKDVTSHIYLARIAALRGKLEEGIRHLEQVVPTRGEQGAQALLQLIQWYIAVGNIDLAQQRLMFCDAHCQSLPGYPLVQALLLRAKGKTEDAQRLLATLASKYPTFPEVWIELGRVRRELGDFQGAKTAFQRAADLPDADPIARFELALTLLDNRETSQALEILQGLVKQGAFPDAYTLLAKIQASEGQVQQAKTTLETLTQKYPDFAEGHLLLGLLKLGLKQPKGAKQALTTAIELDPRLAQAWIHLANLAAASHHMKTAKTLLEKGIQAAPDHPELYYHLGLIHEHEHEWEQAAKAYEAALQRQPDFAAAMNNLALTYVKLHKNLREAERLMRSLYASRPQDPLVMANLGWVLVNRGDISEGLPLLENGVQALADNPELHYFLSVAYQKQGRQRDARKELELARKFGLPIEYQTP
ncbi:MAG: tetratricopeptide repeat protein [Nitrospirae bacterium]|nr:MAG: tetratricopeptide repeat protein [Nitrospirota bacterium]